MYRVWGKIMKNNRIMKQHVSECLDNNLIEKEMRDWCVEDICKTLDISKPIWLRINERDYQAYGRTIFRQDMFMEEIDFDAFEIELLKDEKEKKIKK